MVLETSQGPVDASWLYCDPRHTGHWMAKAAYEYYRGLSPEEKADLLRNLNREMEGKK